MKCTYAFFVWLVIGVFSTLYPSSSHAASLYIDPAMSQIHRGDSITMSVRLDTDEAAGECVNTVDAVISYPENIEPQDVSIGESILRVWVEEPTIHRDTRTITFAGGIPNGYCGRVVGDPRLTNILAKIVFQSPGFVVGGGAIGTEATISFGEESAAYLNDGLGTKATLSTYPAKIELDPKLGGTITNKWQEDVNADDILPEEFSISLQKDDKAFSQKYYIVFSTTDKQTGIDHYEVMEESLAQFGSFQWGRADAPWVETRSPYVLTDQSLNSIIRVKAIDKAGNEYIATLIPDETLRTLSHGQFLSIVVGGIGGLLVLVLVTVLILWIRRRRKHATMDDVSPTITDDISDVTDQGHE
jgi:hypothetical protein